MGQLFTLEDFSVAPSEKAPAPEPALSEAELDAIRHAAYENGFRDGAADALASVEADETRLRADIAAAVQSLGFTYQEAVAHVMGGVAPVLRALVEQVLPAMLAETVGHAILEELLPLAEQAADIPVRVLVSKADANCLRHVLGENSPLPLAIVEDASLTAGQAHLRLAGTERQIDVAAVLQRISTALSAVTELNERTLANG
ncbi:FliH/SctL family protein [Roseitranquillus sediminis]|uniref:FliH/SctL family protein n=1 Tax=Roseitranquillus sediminis TaxID=2809051 RepID=UPI001D0CCC95|nr:hypothetical protein [Roseitranquillus sediminis]MBM9596138.1 hypothetical protein [Roseitranquillus sediminis]